MADEGGAIMENGQVVKAQVTHAFDYGLWLKAEHVEREILVRIIDLPVDPPIFSARRFADVGDVHKVELFHFDSEYGYYHGRIISEKRS